MAAFVLDWIPATRMPPQAPPAAAAHDSSRGKRRLESLSQMLNRDNVPPDFAAVQEQITRVIVARGRDLADRGAESFREATHEVSLRVIHREWFGGLRLTERDILAAILAHTMHREEAGTEAPALRFGVANDENGDTIMIKIYPCRRDSSKGPGRRRTPRR